MNLIAVLNLRLRDINSDSVHINTAYFVGSDCCSYSVLVLAVPVVQNRQKMTQHSMSCFI